MFCWLSTCVNVQAALTANVHFLDSNDISINFFEFFDDPLQLVTPFNVPLHATRNNFELFCSSWGFVPEVVTCTILMPSVGLVSLC